MQQIQGTWKVTEVNYIYESHTQTYYPNEQLFVFENNNYEHWQNGVIAENGNFSVNPKVTQIQFFSDQGGSYTYYIIDRNENTQHWKSKAKLIDFYLDFKLEKID